MKTGRSSGTATDRQGAVNDDRSSNNVPQGADTMTTEHSEAAETTAAILNDVIIRLDGLRSLGLLIANGTNEPPTLEQFQDVFALVAREIVGVQDTLYIAQNAAYGKTQEDVDRLMAGGGAE